MDNKDIIVLGKLKKEKSSKPFFVGVVFVFLVAGVYFFPYIKAALGEDFTLTDLLNKPIENEVITTTSTTTVTTMQVVREQLKCTGRTHLVFSFNENGELIKITDKLTYNFVNRDEYVSNFNIYQNNLNDVKSLGGTGTIYETDSSFVYEVIIEVDNDFATIKSEYYSLGTRYEVIKSELSNRGYDCK